MNLDPKGKVAVVTGGSAGIGLAIADAMAAEGVDLVICGRDRNRLGQAANEIHDRHAVSVVAVPADVSTADGAADLISAARDRHGGVDILINNAGAGSNETILEAPDEKWQHYWDLHVMAAVRLSRGMAPAMRARGGGVILNNASICAKQPLGYEPIYNTTKAALMMLSKCLANELVKDGIRVNCVNPGLVLTPDWQKTAKELTAATSQTAQQYLDAIAKQSAPIGRFASPEEVAQFLVFLCSPRASYCVGSTYYIDGGWLGVVA